MPMPALGAISYATTTDSYSFGPFAKSHVTATPLPDRAGRTTKAVRYTVRVDDIVYADPSSDGFNDITNRMRRVKRILTTRCGHLTYTGRGFGTPELDELDVNDPDNPQGIRDVMYGPVPEIIEFYPLGGMNAQAAKIVWQVTTVIPECSNARFTRAPMDFSYEVDWRIEQGYTTRTITGQLEVPATRINGARTPPDVADNYWDQILDAMPPLPGFRRSSSRRLSLDKRILSFTVTDQELEPSAFFGGTDTWSGDHTVGSQLMGGAFTIWMNTLNATFKVTRDRKKEDAWGFFTLLLNSRIRTKDNYLPVGTQIREELQGQSVSLTHSWKITVEINKAGNGREKFLIDNGLFAPIAAADWQKWAKTKQGTTAGALAARGYMGLGYKPEWDAIIDLCTQQKIANAPPKETDPAPKQKGPVLEIKIPPEPGNQQGFGNIKGIFVRKPPKAADSFLSYECHLAFVGTGGNARHKPLGYTTNAQSPVDPMDVNARTHLQQGSNPPDVIQSISAATCRVVLWGEAIRAGFAVVAPKLLEIGGVKAVLDDEQFENADLGNAGGLSVVGGRWVLTYILDRVPTGAIAVPTNLLAPQDGSGVERV